MPYALILGTYWVFDFDSHFLRLPFQTNDFALGRWNAFRITYPETLSKKAEERFELFCNILKDYDIAIENTSRFTVLDLSHPMQERPPPIWKWIDFPDLQGVLFCNTIVYIGLCYCNPVTHAYNIFCGPHMCLLLLPFQTYLFLDFLLCFARDIHNLAMQLVKSLPSPTARARSHWI